MGKIYQITEDYEERGKSIKREDEDYMLEKAFKEGCEQGYKKAMRDMEFNERTSTHRDRYREGFEEKLARLKEKYK